MGAHHAACKFSATVMTADVAVLHMLRALCQHCESGKYKQIAWGGTGEGDWRKNGNEVTFRFTRQADRDSFLREAQRLLPGLWHLVKINNLDPATPRR
ncbi:hypothetical protein [Paractinoplanes rishiriensis]|uniref:Uncharacterized protein n=1 Tax=Paractinoplanes rishiriensis TaxID=1050105 RepID=A0A919JX07_9ACTN|nr:hypothetical protein [Actinoplanes rishiriensis]GIE96358.1 hypothetical protein Ari01nite_38230 [Actinoplanes rishiriensis]